MRCLICLLVLLTPIACQAETDTVPNPRTVHNIDLDWHFSLGDEPTSTDNMRKLDVPHDWSIEGDYHPDNPTGGKGGYLPGGVGWYIKTIDIPEDWADKQILIDFDGVYMNSEMWINDHPLGKRPYGYISILYDLTPHLKPGPNTLKVRVDNTNDPSSRWYHGCGIYGHVNLIVTDPIHIPQWGTFVTTPHITDARATINVETDVISAQAAATSVRLEQIVLDPAGKQVVTTTKTDIALQKATRQTITQQLTVPKPQRWSVETPNLYTLVSRVYHDNKPVDEYHTTFGIRTIEWHAHKGFLLNGEQVKLKGVCEHHDGGPVGAALYGKVLQRRMQILKDMGCNAIRTAHNPRTPEFYQLCDRMGFLVMDEIFDGWHKKAEWDYGRVAWAQWWQKDTEDWLRRDRNHPSVIMWSIGNETGHTDKHDITGFIHQFDNTRPTTGGTVFYGVDVSGFNGPGGTPGVLEKFKAEHPEQPVVLTEVPHTYQTRGFYRVPTWWRERPGQGKNQRKNFFEPYGEEQIFFDGHPRYSSSYDNAGVRINARTAWKRTRDTDWIAGEFRWTGFDYLGESGWTAGGYPMRLFNHGIIDLAGFPKDHYFFYQSMWTDTPMVHLLPHWTHPHIAPEAEIPVVAYSNADEVELFLNGKSLGRNQREDTLEFLWYVRYQPGQLKAVAYQDGKPVAETTQTTAGHPARIVITTDNSNLAPDRRDFAHITFKLVDVNGVMSPRANDRLDFHFDGPVTHWGFENGDPADVNNHRLMHRRAFHGLGLGILQSTDSDAPIEITAAGILGDPIFQDSATVTIDVQRVMLRGQNPSRTYTVHYTLDNSEPTTASPRYVGPFQVSQTTNVRALVLRDDQPIINTHATFTKGPEPRITDDRLIVEGVATDTEDKTGKFKGPFDKEVLRAWQEKDTNRVFEFRADGTLYRTAPGDERAVAYWWYDFPNDPFEDPSDNGSGQLRWINSGQVTPLELADRDASSLNLGDGDNLRVFIPTK